MPSVFMLVRSLQWWGLRVERFVIRHLCIAVLVSVDDDENDNGNWLIQIIFIISMINVDKNCDLVINSNVNSLVVVSYLFVSVFSNVNNEPSTSHAVFWLRIFFWQRIKLKLNNTTLVNALNIDWLCWSAIVVTTLRPSTWPGTSTGSPTMTLDDVCDGQQHSSSRSLERDSAPSAIGPFKSPVLVCVCGMRCLHRLFLLRHWLSSRVI